VSLRHAVVVGVVSLLLGCVVLALWGLVTSALAGIPRSVFEVVADIAEIAIFVALGKKMLGIAAMYNRTRVRLFVVALLALLFAMGQKGHCNAPLLVQKVGQLVMLLYFMYVIKPLHGPFSRCPWRWAFGIKGLVVCFLFGKWVTCLVPSAPCAASAWWFTLGLAGAVVTFVAMVMAAAEKWDTHGVKFLASYGIGNVMLALSNLGEHQYSAPALCITSALVAIVVWTFAEKGIHWVRHHIKGKAHAGPERCVDLPVPEEIPVGIPVVALEMLPVIEPVEGPVLEAQRIPIAPPVVAQE
jgi:hypothetical protein